MLEFSGNSLTSGNCLEFSAISKNNFVKKRTDKLLNLGEIYVVSEISDIFGEFKTGKFTEILQTWSLARCNVCKFCRS